MRNNASSGSIIRNYTEGDAGEDNADEHIKRQSMGREVFVAVTEGRLGGH